MAKFELRIKARQLRKEGVAVKEIAEKLRVSKGSVSVWVRDVILSIEQLESLRNKSLKGAERGRLKSALLQKEKWQRNMEEHTRLGRKTIRNLSDREFLIAGLALYWGEGTKKNRRVELCNSDPEMIKFFLLWLNKCFEIEDKDVRCYIGINQIHRSREEILREYWSEVTGISLDQFRKVIYKKVVNKKVYDNFETHYGTLTVRVVKPSRFYGKIMGLIEGLSGAGRRLVFRDVS